MFIAAGEDHLRRGLEERNSSMERKSEFVSAPPNCATLCIGSTAINIALLRSDSMYEIVHE